MATFLRRWWTSLGHGVHSPSAFRLITLILDQRGIGYYPEHLAALVQRIPLPDEHTQQLALQLLHQWPLLRLITDDGVTSSCGRTLILWQGTSLEVMPWDSGSILWHIGRQIPDQLRQRERGLMVDYRGGQLLILDSKQPRQTFWTRIRH